MVKRVMVMAAVEKETRDGYRLTSFDLLRFVLHDLPSKFIDRGEREMNLPFSFFPLYLPYLSPFSQLSLQTVNLVSSFAV